MKKTYNKPTLTIHNIDCADIIAASIDFNHEIGTSDLETEPDGTIEGDARYSVEVEWDI